MAGVLLLTLMKGMVIISTEKDNCIIDSYFENDLLKVSDIFSKAAKSFLEKNKLNLIDIKNFYVIKGPGSYTGVRVGLTFVKTIMAINPNIGVYELSSLHFLAGLEKAITVIDAKSNQSYVGVYENDIVRFAISKNILFGPGRGSAAGSLVSFLLKITSIDPIENDLIFERFLNVQRKTLPDIDIDFEDSRRDEIINYLAEKYSENKFSTIVTFQKIGIKNALRDVGRAFNINSTKINQISKLLSDDNNFDLDFAIKKSLELKKYFQENPQLYKGMKKIIGFPRQSGTHAAGVIFSDINLLEILPIKYNHSGILQTQFPMEFLEELGLIKTDILGLRNLSTIQEIIFQIQKNKDPNFNINKINLEDKDTFKLLESGDTSGIFQLESEGMTNVIMKIKPNSILDIANASSLYRPGPQENIPEFIKRKNKNFKNEKNILDKLLSDTYGIIVYQEQVLNIFTIISKMDLNQADIVRRAISKKDSAKLESVKNDFIQRSIDNGYEKNAVEEI
ncbi:hypothetical protein FQR65_LT16464 [Abscondita terminalis]|nr:hypothetical protein FQR65_LT16464 [Abscondita terminalis]